ncbi:MAG: hypothetical protein HOU81_24790 [Hamadaea sp.]|uniref:hypothetical protein n=1 Tax=Hamadaea sp. TaxID=2024425 RepID=UPI0017924884|nr:hypothetical protein [Hamadaea sp.]NUR74043.1 hypothetical protein [Hamadaea sp.]NUT23553.1 hypothetical protein [Hamadaea sp.]
MRKYAFTAVLVAGLVLTGCKSSGPGVASAGSGAPVVSSSTSAGPSPAADEGERAIQFQQCMRDHGVEVQTEEDKGGVAIQASPGQKQKALAATEACRMYLPGGADKPRMAPEDIERLRQFAQCMRDHGILDWPDPDPETGAVQFTDAAAIKRDPKLPEAMRACDNLQPHGTSGGKG